MNAQGARGLLALAGVVLLGGCDAGDDPTGPEGPAKVEISIPSTFVELGQKLLLTATVQNASGRKLQKVQVSWSSSNPTIAEVADGLVTGRYPGSAWIRASAGGVADSVQVTVEGPPVGEVVVWPDTLYLIRGRAGKLFVEVRDPAGKPMAHPLLFSSSAPEVASVNGSGEVQGVALGSAAVTVTAGLKSLQVPVRVVSGERYSVSVLPTLGSTASPELARSTANDINNRGEVAGESLGSSGYPHAVLWSRGKVVELAPPTAAGFRRSSAMAVNDSGAVVGSTGTDVGSGIPRGRPWTWRKGSLSFLAGLDTLTNAGVAVTGLNNRGQVVGYTYGTYFKDTSGKGFLWQNGQVTWLPQLAGMTAPDAINDRGTLAVNGFDQCVMCGADFKPSSRAYAGEHPSYALILPTDTAGLLWSANDIDESGRVVGSFRRREGAAGGGGFLWESGKFTQLSLPGAVAINRYGDVVGGTFVLRNGQAINLNQAATSAEWEIVGVSGINDLGQIIAQGKNRSTGTIQALLLTPAP